MDRTFDWKPNFDEKSREFPIRALIRTSPQPRNKLWRIGPILDQQSEGACVGFGWTADALATPIAVNLDRVRYSVPREPNQFARNLYRIAQTIDEWPGEDYEGTSVLAGAKVMKEFGLVKEYRWSFSIQDLIDTVLVKGPVVVGTVWYESMYTPKDGVLNLKGDIVGGHCYLVVGYAVNHSEEDSVIVQNSWGSDWGSGGLATIKISDMNTLLKQDGEACIPSRRSYGR